MIIYIWYIFLGLEFKTLGWFFSNISELIHITTLICRRRVRNLTSLRLLLADGLIAIHQGAPRRLIDLLWCIVGSFGKHLRSKLKTTILSIALICGTNKNILPDFGRSGFLVNRMVKVKQISTKNKPIQQQKWLVYDPHLYTPRPPGKMIPHSPLVFSHVGL